MVKPKVLILTGYGINCEEETSFAYNLAGGESKVVHINDLIANPSLLKEYQVFSFPGGFSYGDDTGSGKALANKIKNNLQDEFLEFISRDTLMLGICNGFQVMVNLGIVPALIEKIGKVEVSLEHNSTSRYQCRWVELSNAGSNSVFTRGIKSIRVPIAHGEGRFYAEANVLKELEDNKQISFRYTRDGQPAEGEFPFNPNGALNDIAAVCDKTGRIMGMMPHPERYIYFTQGDNWTRQRDELARKGISEIPEEGEGLIIFKNAINYFN